MRGSVLLSLDFATFAAVLNSTEIFNAVEIVITPKLAHASKSAMTRSTIFSQIQEDS